MLTCGIVWIADVTVRYCLDCWCYHVVWFELLMLPWHVVWFELLMVWFGLLMLSWGIVWTADVTMRYCLDCRCYHEVWFGLQMLPWGMVWTADVIMRYGLDFWCLIPLNTLVLIWSVNIFGHIGASPVITNHTVMSLSKLIEAVSNTKGFWIIFFQKTGSTLVVCLVFFLRDFTWWRSDWTLWCVWRRQESVAKNVFVKSI